VINGNNDNAKLTIIIILLFTSLTRYIYICVCVCKRLFEKTFGVIYRDRPRKFQTELLIVRTRLKFSLTMVSRAFFTTSTFHDTVTTDGRTQYSVLYVGCFRTDARVRFERLSSFSYIFLSRIPNTILDVAGRGGHDDESSTGRDLYTDFDYGKFLSF